MDVFIFKIYVLTKPSGEKLLYRTFSSAEAACRVGGSIEEWTTVEGSERLVLLRVFDRVTRRVTEILTP
jgi:hypothetical protein